MKENSLFNEYNELLPGVSKIFVIPQIPTENKNTSYLYQLYKPFLNDNPTIKIETFNAGSLPKIFLSRIISEKSILHYHWFEFEDFKSFVGIKWKIFWIILYKIFGGKIIWTVHNKYPHHNKFLFWNKKIERLFAKIADRLHVHCESAIELMSVTLNVKKEKFFMVKHPEFDVKIFDRQKAIEGLNQKYFNNKLSIEDKIFLMFGAIAEYKGIKEVIEIFKTLESNYKLVIAGFIKKGNLKYLNELQNIVDEKNIFLEVRLVPDEDVPYFLNSADYNIFNYRDILTSGGVFLAINYRKKIIAPALGCLKELNKENIIYFDADEKRNRNLKEIIHNLTK